MKHEDKQNIGYAILMVLIVVGAALLTGWMSSP